jgi:hypothetical protein
MSACWPFRARAIALIVGLARSALYSHPLRKQNDTIINYVGIGSQPGSCDTSTQRSRVP